MFPEEALINSPVHTFLGAAINQRITLGHRVVFEVLLKSEIKPAVSRCYEKIINNRAG